MIRIAYQSRASPEKPPIFIRIDWILVSAPGITGVPGQLRATEFPHAIE
jgi:hypothetical protein